MKKIFIIIPEALLIRNILRSGTLELLKNGGHQLYIFIVCNAIPDYIEKEFSADNVKLMAVPDSRFRTSKIHKALILFSHFLILNDTTRVYFKYSRHYINKSWWIQFGYLLLLNTVGRLSFLKSWVRWMEIKFFPEKNEIVMDFFDKFSPDLLFSTSITAKVDNVFLKEAKRRKVKTISMTKSWDNATKMYFRFIPDYFIVQNEIVKEMLITLQNFPDDDIYTVGFPQFDWYTKSEIIKTREEHFKIKGLDPTIPVIFFASQGIWYRDDYKIAEMIHGWIMNNELVKPCQMIVRPHFTNVKNTPLQKLRGLPLVVYDDNYHISYDFNDNWDPNVADIVDFTNTLKHSDVIVVMLSTIALDAACFDKPVIDTLFGGTYQKGVDVTDQLAKVVHYQWVFRTNGTVAVHNPIELKDAINQYLINPTLHHEGRQRIVEELNYKVDGFSSKRLVDAINDVLSK